MNTALLHLETQLLSLQLALASHEFLTNMSSEDVRNGICRQCGTGKECVSAHLVEGNSQRENLQLGTQVWKLVCSSHLREEFLRSCWIELRDTCFWKTCVPYQTKSFGSEFTGGQHVGGTSYQLKPNECACLAGS